jgi:hypothetical protein
LIWTSRTGETKYRNIDTCRGKCSVRSSFYALLEPLSKLIHTGHSPTTWWWEYLTILRRDLQLVGVGYRANIEGKDLVLSLGFSHPVRMTTPGDLQVKVEENTRIVVSGNDRCSIGEFAASIRRWRPPEPYKGKGVRYANEVIRLKEGKAGKKK